MSRSAIYTVNNSSQSVDINGAINLGSIIRRYGPNVNLAGTAIQVCGQGYYDVDASITLAPTAAGTVTVTMFKDGIAVPGAVASGSTTTADNPVNLSITSLVREFCPCADGISNLTFVLSDTAATVTNISIVVDKI